MRGRKQDRNARVIIAGHAFVRTSAGATTGWRLSRRQATVAVAFDELAAAI